MLRQPGQHLLNEFNQSVKWADLATSATNNMVTCNFSGITFAMQRLSLSDFITSNKCCGCISNRNSLSLRIRCDWVVFSDSSKWKFTIVEDNRGRSISYKLRFIECKLKVF